MKIKGKKAQVQISLIPEVAKKAHALGLNISKISENALKQAVNSLEDTKCQNNRFSLSEGSLSPKRESSWCGRRDLNPSTRLGKPGS
jgi:post-segregation antitoxin (ccd killing protein)